MMKIIYIFRSRPFANRASLRRKFGWNRRRKSAKKRNGAKGSRHSRSGRRFLAAAETTTD